MVWGALTSRLARVPTSVKEMGAGTQGLASTGGSVFIGSGKGTVRGSDAPLKGRLGNSPVP